MIRRELTLPPEPVEARAETRALIEEAPEKGIGLVKDGYPLSGLLWEEWGEELADAGIDHDRFVEIARGYADEIRLWVMGERIWEHCAAGFAGRVRRRIPNGRREQEPELASCGDSR